MSIENAYRIIFEICKIPSRGRRAFSCIRVESERFRNCEERMDRIAARHTNTECKCKHEILNWRQNCIENHHIMHKLAAKVKTEYNIELNAVTM